MKLNSHFSKVLIFGLLVLAVACSKNGGTGSNGDDTINPVITTRGPMMTAQGEKPDYRKGVTFTDNLPGVTMVVDSSKVNLNAPGTYDVVYTATDAAGNTTSKTETIRVVGPNEKIVYLTFDDGPSKLTPQILEVLKQKGVKATFFVTGQFKHHMHFMQDIEKEGHAIAAHTYTHDFQIYTSMKTYFDDLDSIQRAIQKWTGHRTRIIRFPGGSSNTAFRKRSGDPDYMVKLIQAVQDSGYQYVDWNLSNGDASGAKMSAAALIKNACRDTEPQYCILMHDTGSKQTTVEALPTIIDYFKARGYKFEVINSVDYVNHHHRKRLNNVGSETAKAKPAPTPAAKPASAPAAKPAPAPAAKPASAPKAASSSKPSSHSTHKSSKDSESKSKSKTHSSHKSSKDSESKASEKKESSSSKPAQSSDNGSSEAGE